MSVDQLCHSYLIAIASLQNAHKQVRSVDIAKKLGCSRASVNYAIGKLKTFGFVSQQRYKRVMLTDKGKEKIADMHQTHKLLQNYLIQTLDIDEGIASLQARKFELCVIDEVLTRVREIY